MGGEEGLDGPIVVELAEGDSFFELL